MRKEVIVDDPRDLDAINLKKDVIITVKWVTI